MQTIPIGHLRTVPSSQISLSVIAPSNGYAVCAQLRIIVIRASCVFRYLDVSVFNELKRRNFVREAKEEQKQKDAKKKKRRSVVASCASETPRTAAQVDEEDDIVGAVADDAEGEFIRNVCEKEIVTGGGLLGMFAPMLSKVGNRISKKPEAGIF